MDSTLALSMSSNSGCGADNEWLEIENTSNREFDISSWKLDDKEGGSKPYSFKPGTILKPNSFFIIDREESRIAFNNTIDSVRLLTPSGNVYSKLSCTGVKEGKSLIVVNGEFQISETATPGERNIKFLTQTPIQSGTSPTLENILLVPHGTLITVEGVVTAPPYLFAKRYFYIQLLDEERELLPNGMQVYMQKADFPTLILGSIVALSGTISLTSLEPKLLISTKESVYDQGETLELVPNQLSITDINDKDIGSYISVEGEVLEKSNNNFYIADDTDEIRIYLQPNTSIKTKSIIPGDLVSVSGILSKTKTGFRILPRKQDDIKNLIVAGITDEQMQQ